MRLAGSWRIESSRPPHAGYRALRSWLVSIGQLERVGAEGTGAYRAALSRFLHSEGVQVIEVDRPDRKTRRAKGKSDPIDAYAAALAALSGAPRKAATGASRRSGPFG